MTISTDDLRARDGLAFEQVEEELLILDERNQKIHQLNPTARAVWRGIENGSAIDNIVSEIVKTFDVTQEVASQDVKRILNEFNSLNLVEKKT
ncbi:MAG: PqqD family protein [Woeseia sp.]|nr:PqqD family protein [Woeseia sp.]MBT8097552.1 PqqD family protein [Woeseia sp.]NNE61118.1 PqqD family protein [Woeseia sp.]NNL55721.1 PqqD family protein [Woeseia sp.]